MENEKKKGRVTIPTDVDVVKETLDLVERWGADAIRDCDGTDYPEELRNVDAKVYSTYYTTRKDNTWAKANPDEIQQMYIMTSFHTATGTEFSIHLMDHLYPDMLKVNANDDITRWWEVIDRTTGEVVPTSSWEYSEENGDVTIHQAYRRKIFTIFLPGYISRGWRSGERGKGELGDSTACYLKKTNRPDRIWRLSEACHGIPGIYRLCRKCM